MKTSSLPSALETHLSFLLPELTATLSNTTTNPQQSCSRGLTTSRHFSRFENQLRTQHSRFCTSRMNLPACFLNATANTDPPPPSLEVSACRERASPRRRHVVQSEREKHSGEGEGTGRGLGGAGAGRQTGNSKGLS